MPAPWCFIQEYHWSCPRVHNRHICYFALLPTEMASCTTFNYWWFCPHLGLLCVFLAATANRNCE